MDYFEKGLSIIGYADIAKHPTKMDILKKIILFKYYLRNHNIDAMPVDVDEKQYFIYTMALHLAQECYFSGDILRWAYIFLAWGVDTFPYHDRNLRTLYISVNAIIWPHNKKSYNLVNKLMSTFRQSSRKELTVSFYLGVSALTLAWHIPLEKCISNFKKSVALSEQCGDLEFCATAYLTCITASINKQLPSLCRELLSISQIILLYLHTFIFIYF